MPDLRERIIARIARDGPMSLSTYMDICLTDPAQGYYTRRDPLGRGGDFTTAPEISQLFGEMIGIWAGLTWQAMGAPARFALVELGPGRGTLMADLLRAGAKVPGFSAAAQVNLVEISPVLAKAQAAGLAGSGVRPVWHRRIEDLPAGPMIVIANEFFDALPIRQYVHQGGVWRERQVGASAGRLVWQVAQEAAERPLPRADDGDIREFSDKAIAIAAMLGERLARDGGAMLAIDYGYAESQSGDSFQAMAGHAYTDPFSAPGQADLTAHVDFAALGQGLAQAGADVHPVLTQASFLRRMGIEARTVQLCRLHPDRAEQIVSGFERLTDDRPTGMGRLFKALAATSHGVQPPAFDPRGR